MSVSKLNVYEFAPAADELWEMEQSSSSGFLAHPAGMVSFPDVASGAKLRPRVTASYASGKATNIARVFDAFLRSDAQSPLARQAQEMLAARLVTSLPAEPRGYQHPELPGKILSQFTPGGAYMACLQARDFYAVELDFHVLPPSSEVQVDRRCANLFSNTGGELINFSPYLHWDTNAAEATVNWLRETESSAFIALAGSLPLVEDVAFPALYARAIRSLRQANPQTVISLDVGGAPLQVCLEAGPSHSPDVISINVEEYCAVPAELWLEYEGVAVPHDKRGCWLLQCEAMTREDFANRPPDIRTPEGVLVVHTICAGDASHGGLLLGLMLHGMEPAGLREAAMLSQACGLTIVESRASMRGLTADQIETNLLRIRETNNQ